MCSVRIILLNGILVIVYKAVGEPSVAAFDAWLDTCQTTHGHNALNLVGAATSKLAVAGGSRTCSKQEEVYTRTF